MDRPVIRMDDGPNPWAQLLAGHHLLLAVHPLHHCRVGVHLRPHHFVIAQREHIGVLATFRANGDVGKGDDQIAVSQKRRGVTRNDFSANRASSWPSSPLPWWVPLIALSPGWIHSRLSSNRFISVSTSPAANAA